jgi:hypothetical protein
VEHGHNTNHYRFQVWNATLERKPVLGFSLSIKTIQSTSRSLIYKSQLKLNFKYLQSVIKRCIKWVRNTVGAQSQLILSKALMKWGEIFRKRKASSDGTMKRLEFTYQRQPANVRWTYKNTSLFQAFWSSSIRSDHSGQINVTLQQKKGHLLFRAFRSRHWLVSPSPCCCAHCVPLTANRGEPEQHLLCFWLSHQSDRYCGALVRA